MKEAYSNCTIAVLSNGDGGVLRLVYRAKGQQYYRLDTFGTLILFR
ncbi:MAG: hypothetical protein LBT46_04600 [Planctomycetaceae bacterium]|jgi:hypothetical protein|nr:hypothetical protein [Planctomycetaceae bacterium]